MAQRNVFLVTGAAGGIGFEMVRILIEKYNSSVVALDVIEGSLKELSYKHPSSLRVIIGDITDASISEQGVAVASKDFGGLTGVALNAGVFGPCYPMDNSPVDEFARGFAINVFSHLHTLKYALPELRKTQGRVVATTSGAGHNNVFKNWAFYGSSKAAVEFLIRQLHLEEPLVTAIGISPGLCDTPMVHRLTQEGGYAGWTKEAAEHYSAFVDQVRDKMITPTIAGEVYALALMKGNRNISGLILDFDDSRLNLS